MLFAPYLVCQAGGSALPDHIQPVLKFYLFIRSQSGNVHRYSPLSGFRVFGVNPKNSNPDFTGERHIFHYTFLFDAYDIRRHKRKPPCKHITSNFPAFQLISLIRPLGLPAEKADRRIKTERIYLIRSDTINVLFLHTNIKHYLTATITENF